MAGEKKTSELTLDATPGAGSYVPYVDPTEAADADKNKRILFSDVDSAAGLVIGTDVQAFDAANVTDTSTSTLTNKTISSLTNQVVADEIHFEIRNESGGTLTKGTPVFVSGFNVGQDLVEVDSADATSSATMQAIGLIEADVATGATGSAVSMGVLEGLDTSSYSVGDVLYVSETAGTLTATAPTGSALAQEVGVVIRSNPSTGSILISMTETNLTGFAYTLLDDGDAATARTTLGVAIGTDVQAHDAVLDATTASFTTADETKLDGIEALADVTDAVNVAAAGAPIITSGAGAPVSTPAAVGDIYVDTTGDNVYSAAGTASSADWKQATGAGGGDLLAANNLSDLANASTGRTNLGVAIGSDVQAYSAALDAVSGTNTGDEVASSASVAGVVELATIAEVDTGTDDVRAVTPAGLAGSALQTKVDGIAAGAEVNTVDSVNSATGAVVLDADDISDAATTNKFTTAADISKLAAIEALADVTDSVNVVSALDGATITDAGTPAATDQILIKDAGTGALQSADFSEFGGGGGGAAPFGTTTQSSPSVSGFFAMIGARSSSSLADSFGGTDAYWFPFVLGEETDITELSVDVLTGTGSNTRKLCIAEDSAGAPGTLVANSTASIDMSTSSTYRTTALAATVTLTPGRYWLGMRNSASGTAVRCGENKQYGIGITSPGTDIHNDVFMWTKETSPAAFGSWPPATVSTIEAGGAAAGNPWVIATVA